MLHIIYTLFHTLLINLGYIINISHVIKFLQKYDFQGSFNQSPITGNSGLSTFCYCK